MGLGGGDLGICGQNIYYHVSALVIMTLRSGVCVWGGGGGSAGHNICYHDAIISYSI